MNSFPGFGIAGYRSLHGPLQWIPLGDDITIVLGPNNSGKTNVLRLLHLHLAEIYSRLRGGSSAMQGFDLRVDAPRAAEDSTFRVHWPLDVASFEDQIPRNVLPWLLEHPWMSRFGVFGLDMTAADIGSALEVSPQTLEEVKQAGRADEWTTLSAALTSTRGGAPGEDTRRVLNWLRQHLLPPPKTIYVPPARSMNADGNGDDWDFGGTGVLRRLHRMLNPEHDEDELRDQIARLREDLSYLLEDPELEIGVPHDFSTINVRLGGSFFPLQSLGTGTEHAVLMLAARHVFPDHLLCLEEPDAHLHPRLQRRLMSLLRDPRHRRLVVATHSAHIIDLDTDLVLAVRQVQGRTALAPIGDSELFEELRSLGYRASDLLQANAVIWVEGPSDRIYLLHWLAAVDDSLKEGVDFSIMFYGGALLKRLSAAEDGPVDPTLVDLWRINQRMWIVMDSDIGDRELKDDVVRLRKEMVEARSGGTWITAGYTVENYVPPDLLLDAAKDTHASVVRIKDPKRNLDPLTRLARKNGSFLKQTDKVAIALAVTHRPARLDVLDLEERINELAAFIREDPASLQHEVIDDPHHG